MNGSVKEVKNIPCNKSDDETNRFTTGSERSSGRVTTPEKKLARHSLGNNMSLRRPCGERGVRRRFPPKRSPAPNETTTLARFSLPIAFRCDPFACLEKVQQPFLPRPFGEAALGENNRRPKQTDVYCMLVALAGCLSCTVPCKLTKLLTQAN